MLRRAGLAQAVRLLHYCLIVLAAWAAAAVVIRVVGIELTPKVGPLASTDQAAAKVGKSRQAAGDAIILRRNLFGTSELDVAADETPAAAGGADLRLRGIAASQGASFAVFENTDSGEQNVFRVGEKIFDGPKLVGVDTTGADVLLRGKTRRYEIEDDVALAPEDGKRGAKTATRGGKTRPEKPARPEKGSKAKAGAAAAGVKKTGESAYLVDRREVEHTVANLNEVITQARAVPVMAGGKGAGFKLFNIKSGSIFEKLGLLDGDIVQRVNDTELSDPSKAVGLLEEIQSMGQIRVNFVRGGKPRSYTYTIR